MSENHIVVEFEQGVAQLVLNRPNVHNALSADMMVDFVKTCQQLSDNDEVKVVVLTGAGEKSFCSGADLGGMGDNAQNSVIDFKNHVTKYHDCLIAIRKLKKPIIAAVNGYALAGGMGLVAACDLVFAKESATFGTPEINVGLWGMMISKPLISNIGLKNTFELLYTGDRIDVNKAKEMGLVNEIFENEYFREKIQELAKKLAKKNPVALAQGRESMYMIEDMDYETALRYLRDQVVLLSRTEDYSEGLLAFKEKRDPVWKGR